MSKQSIELHRNLSTLMIDTAPSIKSVMAAIAKGAPATLSDHAVNHCNNDRVIYSSLFTQIKKLVMEGGAYHDLLGVKVFPSSFRSKAPEWAMKNGKHVDTMKNASPKPDWTKSKSITNAVNLGTRLGMELEPLLIKNMSMGSKKARETNFSLLLIAQDAIDDKALRHAAEVEELRHSLDQRLAAVEQALQLSNKTLEPA